MVFIVYVFVLYVKENSLGLTSHRIISPNVNFTGEGKKKNSQQAMEVNITT